MDVYSYIGASAAPRKQITKKSRMNFSVAEARKSSDYTIFEFEKPDFSRFADTARSQKATILNVKNSVISKIINYYPLILVALIFAVVPVMMFNILSYHESHTSPLKFSEASVTEFEFLNSAMSKFAMETVVADVDENGNVLAADGSILSTASVGVGQAVTFREYKVCSGDSISTITRKFGLSNVSTLIAVNGISNVRTLRAGQKLRIPSQDGLVYKVSSGDSLNSISVKFHVSVEEILDANDLTSDVLYKNMELFIPGAKMDASSLKRAMGELFVSPLTAKWRLTSYFGPRKDPFSGAASNHTGIDMACPQGTPIRAAMSGRVAYVGWSNVYGNYVIIDHGNGYQSLYYHMQKSLAKTGQNVDQNTKIGLVGSTGYSTGPHLHFTVYKNGKLVDPLPLIKR